MVSFNWYETKVWGKTASPFIKKMQEEENINTLIKKRREIVGLWKVALTDFP